MAFKPNYNHARRERERAKEERRREKHQARQDEAARRKVMDSGAGVEPAGTETPPAEPPQDS